MKRVKQLKLILILMLISLGLIIGNKPLIAQENYEDLELCNGPEGTVEDPVGEACVIRDCDCNRTAANGKVGELVCMEKRVVRNEEGQIMYACKFPNSPDGNSCDTIPNGKRCPGVASAEGASIADGAAAAQTFDANNPGIVCEEKLIAWNAGQPKCDSQYNRLVSMDLWQSSVYDPTTGKCKEFYLPNSVLEDQPCEFDTGSCKKGPIDVSCQTKVCLTDGAEVCKETWRDENCQEVTKVGRLTGQKCKTGSLTVDITGAVQTAAQAQLAGEAQEFGLNVVLGFRDRSTVRGYFNLQIGADQSGTSSLKTIWDIAAVWLDGSRFTLNPNNYHQNNFNLNNLSSDALVYILTTRVSETAYEARPQIRIEFSDGSTRDGTLDIKIEPGWVGTSGPKTIEQMLNALEKVTVINPYTGEYFTLDKKDIMNFAQASFPGQITNEEAVYGVTVPLQFRDGSKLTSNATFRLKKSSDPQAGEKTIWDISGVEINGWNFTLNPDNIQSNNFTFWQNPDVITEALKLEVPTQYTEIPVVALVKFSDGTTREAELKLTLNPSDLTGNSPKTITEALSNIQFLTVIDPYTNTEYNFDAASVKNGWGTVINSTIPQGQTEVTLPIKANFPGGAFRTDSITVIYRPW